MSPTVQEQTESHQQLVDELNSLRQRVAELETANAQLWSIYDTAQVVILAHDVDYRIAYMNSSLDKRAQTRFLVPTAAVREQTGLYFDS